MEALTRSVSKRSEEAFAQYLSDTSLHRNHIYFINQTTDYIVRDGLMKDMSVLQESPFTDSGSVVEVFTNLSMWLGIRRIIDNINANAVSA